jgi:hypothetical protein
MSTVGLPDETGFVYILIFLEFLDRPAAVLLTEQVGEDGYRVVSGLDIPLSPEQAVTPVDCQLDGQYVPIGMLLTVTLIGQEGDVDAIRAWSFDPASATFAQVDASRVTCMFSHV